MEPLSIAEAIDKLICARLILHQETMHNLSAQKDEVAQAGNNVYEAKEQLKRAIEHAETRVSKSVSIGDVRAESDGVLPVVSGG